MGLFNFKGKKVLMVDNDFLQQSANRMQSLVDEIERISTPSVLANAREIFKLPYAEDNEIKGIIHLDKNETITYDDEYYAVGILCLKYKVSDEERAKELFRHYIQNKPSIRVNWH